MKGGRRWRAEDEGEVEEKDDDDNKEKEKMAKEDWRHRTLNIQHPTPNARYLTPNACTDIWYLPHSRIDIVQMNEK